MIQRPKYNEIGLTEADNKVLISELTKYAEEGASDDELKSFRDTFISEKKKSTPKDGTKPQSTSTTKVEKSVSVSTDGSLGTPKAKIKDERLDGITQKDVTATIEPRKITTDAVKLKREDEAFKQLTNKKVAEYRQATKVPTEERQAIVGDLKEKKEKQGILNGIQTGLKQGWNAFVDVIGVGGSEETKANWKVEIDPLAEERKEASDFFKSQKIKATPQQIEQKADELFIKNKTLQSKQDRINDYLGALDEQEKTYLEVDAQKRFPTISKERQDISNRISMNEKALAKSMSDLKNPMTEQDRILVEDEIDKITKYLDQDKALFSKATNKLGTAQEEFDAFRRNYNKFENAKARTVASISEGGISFIEGLDYLGTLGGNLGPKEQSEQLFKDTEKARQGIQEYRQQFRPDNKELTLDNFFQYSTDLLANQSGTLLTIAGAGQTGGASILGLGQAGQTYAEMRKANKNGANYAPWQMVIAPAVSGGSTGYFSASPTFETLKNAKNVWKAVLKDPLSKEVAEKAIKTTSNKILKQVIGDTKKEITTELLDNTIQNAVKRDILDDKSVGYFDNSWQVLKDTALMTGLLNAGALPQVTMSAVKMFSKPESNKVLDANGQKIAQLLPQLDNQDISETSRKAIQSEIDKATTENTEIINSTLEKVANLPDSDVKKVVENNTKESELITEAEAIKEDKSIEPKAKQILLDAKKKEFQEVRESTNKIIDAETQITTPDTEVKSETKVQEPTEGEEVKTPIVLKNEKNEEIEVFHGTGGNFKNYDVEKLSETTRFGKGVSFTDGKGIATRYSLERQGLEDNIENDKKAIIKTAKLAIEKPFDQTKTIDINTKEAKKLTTILTTRFGLDEVLIKNILEGKTKDTPFVGISRAIFDKANDEKTFMFVGNTEKTRKLLEEAGYDSVIDFYEDAKEYFVFSQNKIIDNEAKEKRNTPTNGNVPIGISEDTDLANSEKPKTEIAETEVVESAIEPKSSEGDNKVEYAKQEIEKGILQWGGDMGQPRIDLGLSWADIRKGEADIKRGKENSVPAKRLIEAIDKAKSEGGYRYKYGSGTENARAQEFVTFEDMQRITNEMQLTDAEMAQINENEEQLAKEYDEYFNSLDENTQNEILENYENKESTEIGENDKSGKSEINVSNEEKPTRKETRIKATEAKIDEIANSLKGLESVFGIKIKADLGDGKTQGTSRDVLIDFIAKTAKEIAKTGITLDEAIRTVIAEIKKSFDTDIEVDDVIGKIEVEEAPEPKANFEREPGKYSILGRVATGNSQKAKEAIADFSLYYEIENQEIAIAKAKKFVEDFGADVALNEIRDNKIQSGGLKAAMYSAIIKHIQDNISKVDDAERTQSERLLLDSLGEIYNEMSKAGTEAGRFSSMMYNIYKGSNGAYNLTKQIAESKARNNGEISDETLTKFKELDAKIKEYEAKIAELEKERDKQQSEEDFKAIVESVTRRNKIRKKSIFNQDDANNLAKQLRSFKTSQKGSLSSATPASLAYDGAIELVALAIENAPKTKETIAQIIKKGVDFIRGQKITEEEQKQAISNLFDALDYTESTPRGIRIENGKLKIPHLLIRSKVEEGINNIDALVKAVKVEVDKILPEENYTERQIRDAISEYGKIAKMAEDDIAVEISKLKSLGRLESQIEDALSGKRPLRTGMQRRPLTLDERQKLTKLKELLRDLPLEEADVKKAWRTTLESIKSRLRNEIELLNKQIQDGEKRSPEKKQIEYDEDANTLKKERDEKRKILDELVGKPELTDEQKIKKQETLLEKSISNLQEKIIDGGIEYKKKPTPISSAKIEGLKKLKDSLTKELNQMRIDSGLAELKRLQSAKTSRLNRIKEYERRIAQKDFSVRKPKPLPVDEEILEIERNLQEAKAEYEKEKYKDELKNRNAIQKWLKTTMDALGITRLLKAFGELSPLFVQLGFITPRMLIRNPKALFKAIAMMGESIASPDAAERYEAQIKRHPLYPLMMKTKLSITATDHRLKAGEEAFQLDLLNDTWNIAGKGLDALTNDKKVKTITGRIKSIAGKKLNESDYKTVGTQFRDSAPWKILERGTVVLANQMKIAEFERGVRMLEMQGKDPINDASDYKKLASFINVFSGRANLGRAEQISKELGYFIFSVRNAVSQFQQLNPAFYLYTLGSKSQMEEIKKIRSYKDLKNVKPTVAQVMAVDNFMTSTIAIFTFQMAFMAWANANADDDEEKWTVEFDPRSSDFMKMKKGDFSADFWHGLGSWVVLMARIGSGERKTAKGEINKLGVDTPTYLGTVQQFASNKLAPSWGYIYKIADTEPRTDERTGITYRVDQYGNVFGEDEFYDLFFPIYWGAINEIRKTDPDKYEAFLTATGFLGVGVNTRGEQKKFKDMVGGGENKLPSMPSMPKLPKMP